MAFKWRIFAVAFVFALVIGALSNVSSLLSQMFNLTPKAFLWISFAINVASFFVSPVLLFACLYLLGRKIDLVVEFSSVVVPLFLGSWAGHLIGYSLLQFIYIAQYGIYTPYSVTFADLWDWWFMSFMWYGVRTTLSLEFFVGFAALSMAYIGRKRS